jgi:hypothetical protein
MGEREEMKCLRGRDADIRTAKAVIMDTTAKLFMICSQTTRTSDAELSNGQLKRR